MEMELNSFFYRERGNFVQLLLIFYRFQNVESILCEGRDINDPGLFGGRETDKETVKKGTERGKLFFL